MAGYRLFWKDRLGRGGDIFVRLQLKCLELCPGIMHWIFFPRCISFCWTSWVYSQPNFPACSGLFEWQHNCVCISHSQFCIIYKLAEGTLSHFLDHYWRCLRNSIGASIKPWHNTTSVLPPPWLCTTDLNPLDLAVQPVFNPSHCTLVHILPACPWECCQKQCQKSC